MQDGIRDEIRRTAHFKHESWKAAFEMRSAGYARRVAYPTDECPADLAVSGSVRRSEATQPPSGGTDLRPAETEPESKPQKARRGTSNTNSRGSAASRRARRKWIMETFGTEGIVPCYWCDVPLHESGPDAFEVDRLVAGKDGGSYRRGNIVPACPPDNAERGNLCRDGLL